MVYSFDSYVRFSETGFDNKLDIVRVMDYLSDCAMLHSYAVGNGMEAQHASNRAWMLISWQIVADRYPNLGEKIKISTVGTTHDKYFCNRNVYITDENGEFCIRANSVWSYVNMETKRPVSMVNETEAIEAFQPEPDGGIEIDYAKGHLKVPKEGGWQASDINVTLDLYDGNHHVNNAKHVFMAEKALREYLNKEKGIEFAPYTPGGEDEPDLNEWVNLYPGQLRIDFRVASYEGDVITPYIFDEGDVIYVSLKNQNGEICTNVMFEKAGK